VGAADLCVVRSRGRSGGLVVRVGVPLADVYLEFLGGRSRPNTVLAAAYDLKVFFTVVGKPPDQVRPGDVLAFVTAQRTGRSSADGVLQPVDHGGELAGVSSSTVRRRLSVVSGFFAFLQARGDVAANPVPRGLPTRRERSRPRQGVPLVRATRKLPRILAPAEVDALTAALRTHRDRAMVAAMVLGGLRRCEVLGLRLDDLRTAERRVFIAEGKGGRQRLIPVSGRFFAAVATYLYAERPPGIHTGRVFLVRKGPHRGQPLSAKGMEILAGAKRRAGLDHATCHELRHTCLTRLREAGMALEAVQAQAGHASIESTRIYLHLADDWLAGPQGRRGHRRAGLRRPARRAREAGVSGLPQLGVNGTGSLPAWADLEPALPQITATMRRYLTQISCVLRPGSVSGADLALRSFAAFLAETAPGVTSTAQVTHRHIEDYKPWLAGRPGQNKPRLTTATMAHRLGTLRMFFVRLDERAWDEAPPRVPLFPGDLPRQDRPLPKALDDAAAAKLLRAAQDDKRLLVRVTVEMLLRTGLRVSEYTSLRAGAVVHIGAGPWLHVPVGKLREDRYLPLHPHLVAVPPGAVLALAHRRPPRHRRPGRTQL
jgi:site-specific recombinase XerD